MSTWIRGQTPPPNGENLRALSKIFLILESYYLDNLQQLSLYKVFFKNALSTRYQWSKIAKLIIFSSTRIHFKSLISRRKRILEKNFIWQKFLQIVQIVISKAWKNLLAAPSSSLHWGPRIQVDTNQNLIVQVKNRRFLWWAVGLGTVVEDYDRVPKISPCFNNISRDTEHYIFAPYILRAHQTWIQYSLEFKIFICNVYHIK